MVFEVQLCRNGSYLSTVSFFGRGLVQLARKTGSAVNFPLPVCREFYLNTTSGVSIFFEVTNVEP